MEALQSLPPSDDSLKERKCLSNDVETPSSMIVSQPNCSLKQSRLLFPAPGTTSATELTDTPSQHVTSNDTALSLSTTPVVPPQVLQADTSIKGGQGDISRHHMTNQPQTQSPALTASTKLRKTKKERDALRQERERLKAETQALKEEERLRKERDRLKRELEKKARCERRAQEEKARQERRETKEREKRERLEKKEAERQRKEEEERKKREERRKLEFEKQQQKNRKHHKEQEMFAGFFSRLPKTDAQDTAKETKCGRSFDKTVFDEEIQSQVSKSPYLVGCRGCRLRGYRDDRMENDDVIIMSPSTVPPKPQMKLLQFHTNVRPAYFGSWRRKSRVISGRTPLKVDTAVLDYEFDSDDEWEEEEPGESVSSASEGGDESGEDSAEEGDEDGFFVPHGYLSEDEGDRSESENCAGSEMDKVKAKAKAWEAEFQRTCQPKKAVCIGCVWRGEETDEKRREDVAFLSQFSALVLTETPVKVKPVSTASLPETQGGSSATDSLKRPVPEEAMPELIRLVHHSTTGLKKLITTFQAHWGTIIHKKTATTNSKASPEHCVPRASCQVSPQGTAEGDCEHVSLISKRQLEKKIQQIATKEVRAPSTRPTWYVKDDVLQQYNIDGSQLAPLLPVTPMTSRNLTEKSSSPETPLSTPVSKKGAKRKAAGTTLSVKTLFEAAIAKSPQNTPAVANAGQKRLKLTPSPVTIIGKIPPRAAVSCEPPPKKRIRLESLSLIMPTQPKQPPGRAADGSSPHTLSADGTGVSDDVIVINDTSLDSTSAQPSSLDTTTQTFSTSCNVHASLPVQNTSQKPIIIATTPGPAPKNTAGSVTKYLQEVTNHEVSAGGKEGGGGGRGEKKQCIDWERLKNTTDSSKVTVIAEIH